MSNFQSKQDAIPLVYGTYVSPTDLWDKESDDPLTVKDLLDKLKDLPLATPIQICDLNEGRSRKVDSIEYNYETATVTICGE